MILGYSRMRYSEFTVSTDVSTFLWCHLHAFHYFGVDIRRVIQAPESQWNPVFEDSSRHYAFLPRLCRPHRPRSKKRSNGGTIR